MGFFLSLEIGENVCAPFFNVDTKDPNIARPPDQSPNKETRFERMDREICADGQTRKVKVETPFLAFLRRRKRVSAIYTAKAGFLHASTN